MKTPIKIFITILILLALLLPGTLLLSTPAAEGAGPSELIGSRTLNSKTWDLGGGKYALDASVAPVHYQEGGNWLDIDNSLVPAVAPWDYQMTEAGYHVKVKSDITAGQVIEFEKQLQTVYLQPMALEWTNNLDQIQPVAMPSNVDELVTNTPYEILPGVTNNIGNIKWLNAYGPGIDLEWETTPSRLNKVLTVNDFTDLPPVEQFIIDGGEPVLRFNLIFEPSPGLDIIIDQQIWNERDKKTTFGVIEFQHNGETLWGFMPLRYWDSSGDFETGQGQSVATLEKRGNKLYISIRVPYNWLETATYPVFIDTDIDVEIAASADDGFQATDDSVDITGNYGLSDATTEHLGFRFTGITVDAGDTIDVMEFAAYIEHSALDEPDHTIKGQAVANAAAFTTGSNNIDSRARTTASDAWDVNGLGATSLTLWEWGSAAGSPTTGHNLNSILTEIIAIGGWANGNAIVLIVESTSGTETRDLGLCFVDRSGGIYNAELHIEYTAGGGGGSAPTVTSDNTSAVEETTVTFSGNITATGGDNASSRFFQYGTSSGNYTANVTQSGNFTTGTFSNNGTGLSPGTTYYWRAGATNVNGTGYGSELNFTTKPNAPTGLADIDRGSTWISANWTMGAGSENTTIRYRTDTYPTSETDGTLGYSGTASTANITGLSPSIFYYFGAWAVNTDNVTLYSDGSSQDTAWTRPADATNLVASNPDYTTLDLDWTVPASANRTHIRWEAGSFPTDISDGTQAYFSTGNSTTVTGLPSGTLIYFNAWAYADNSTYYSSGNISATGTTLSLTAPTVVTDNASSISYESASGNGNITATGGANATERGFQYGIGAFTDNVSEGGSFGTGNFTLAITGLLDNTEYQHRAYTINGAGIGYGASENFTTLDIVSPTVTSSNATAITSTGATMHGNVVATGGGNYETRIFEWGTASGNYTDNWTSGGSYGTGAFSNAVATLSANTTYYWRAGAINNGNYGYSGELSFTTLAAAAAVPSTPTGFTLTDLGGTNILAEWDASSNATGYLIMVSRTAFPTNTTDFEESYNGTALSANLTGFALEITTYYFSLFAYNAVGISTGYDTASIGGDDMAAEIAGLSLIVDDIGRSLILLGPVILFSVLAFWRRDIFLYLITAPVAVVVGLMWRSYYPTTEALVVSLVLVGLGIYCLLKGLENILQKVRAR